MKFDNLLLGNGISIKIYKLLEKQGLSIINFFDYLECFCGLEEHKRERRDFFKIYRPLVYDDEIPPMLNFVKETFEEAKSIGFERMISSKLFKNPEELKMINMTLDQYDRLVKNVASFYFLIFNYWYIKKVHNIIDYNDEAIKSLSDDIKTLVDGEVYSLNFDKLLDNFINVKHIHGSFADKLEKYQDLVSCMTSSTSFLYKFVFGTSGVEKLSSMNQLYNNNVSGFDYDFLYGDKDFGHLLVYGVSFGLSNIVPQELKGRYKDFYLSNCVEGHILVRLDALYQAKKVKTITIAYYSEEDRSNYQELFKFCDCKEIISYVKCSDLF